MRHFEMPIDRARPPVQTPNGRIVSMPLDRAIGAKDLAQTRHWAGELAAATFSLDDLHRWLGFLVQNHLTALEFQARTYLGQQRHDLAEPLFRSALKLNPGLVGVHLALGSILLEGRGDLDGAEREFRAHQGESAADLRAAARERKVTGEASRAGVGGVCSGAAIAIRRFDRRRLAPARWRNPQRGARHVNRNRS